MAMVSAFDGIDLVQATVCAHARGPDGAEQILRPDTAYPSFGIGRLVLATATARAFAGGALDRGERVVLERGRDLGDRGVLATLGPGLDPTWHDVLVFALVVEDGEAAARLCDRLGSRAVEEAAAALGLDPAVMAAYPEAAPTVTARAASGAALRLPAALGQHAGGVLAALRGSRYRWRVRTRLDKRWEIATAGSIGPRTVEEVALWPAEGGWASAAVAFVDVEDRWSAEYVMGDAFRRVVEALGEPASARTGGGGR